MNKKERIEKLYPVGTVIVVDAMDDPRPIEPGTAGVVRFVDDMGTVHCEFENGRRLGLIPGWDQFHKEVPDMCNKEEKHEGS